MQALIKPLLAKTVVENKLKFPVMLSPKIDGSYGFIQNGKLYARSLKHHENLFTTNYYSREAFNGLRGELIIGHNPTLENLCSLTSSALRTIEGEPETSLWCFDYILPETINLSYEKRMDLLFEKVNKLQRQGYPNIYILPFDTATNLEGYRKIQNEFLEMGYEGCVIRDPSRKYKEGRSSSVYADFWRYKPWDSSEIIVTSLVEEHLNTNEVKKNELGLSQRSSNKDNLIGKNTLGAIVGVLNEDLLDFSGKVIAHKGTEITINTGNLTQKERQTFWDNPETLVGELVEFEYMSYGLKDKPRFAQFKRIRSKVDI